jgi:hypothetical protein
MVDAACAFGASSNGGRCSRLRRFEQWWTLLAPAAPRAMVGALAPRRLEFGVLAVAAGAYLSCTKDGELVRARFVGLSGDDNFVGMNVSCHRLHVLLGLPLALTWLGCSDDGEPSSSIDGGADASSGGLDASADAAPDRRDAAGDAERPPNNQMDAARVVFIGEPTCGTAGHRLQGSIDGKAVAQTVTNAFGGGSRDDVRGVSTYNGTASDGGAINNLRLDWSNPLAAGQITPIRDGTLRNVISTDASATYCVTMGEVALTPEQPAQAVSLQFRITEVQSYSNFECRGPKLSADLRGCVRWSITF